MRRSWWLAALVCGLAGLSFLARGPEAETSSNRLPSGTSFEPRFSGRQTQPLQQLEKSQAPRDLSDLAARYILRSKEGEAELLVRALDLADRAHAADSALPEARFNRALARDLLSLRWEAEDAWSTYLEIDRDSEWAATARARLDLLRRPPAPERWRRQAADLRKAAARGDSARVQRIVAGAPQLAREFAIEQALGDSAAHELRTASIIGQALRAFAGDRSVEDLAKLAIRAQEAHRSFRDGMAAFRESAMAEAGPAFARAVAQGRESGSPIVLWAMAGAARVKAYDGDHEGAVQDFRSVLLEARQKSYLSLAAWCEWGLGWIASRQGRFAEATGYFLSAEDLYDRLHEAENEAAIASFLAENLASLGQAGEAWGYRRKILANLADYPTSLRRHVALLDAAKSAVDMGSVLAGLAIQQEALRAAEEGGDPVRRAEALWGRARILARLGRWKESREDLQEATRNALHAPAGSPREKLFADLHWAEGDTLWRSQPEVGLQSLDEAIRSYADQKVTLNLAHASFSRARLHLHFGRVPNAEADLEEALLSLEGLSTLLEEDDLRTSYSESIQDIYDALILLRWQGGTRPLDALAALERARNLAAVPGSSWERLRKESQQGFAVLQYAVLKDRLLIWVIGDGRIRSLERPVGQAEVEKLVEAFREEIQGSVRPERLEELSSALYDLLIPFSLKAETALYFIPDKALNLVPFSALFNQRTNRFLIEDHTISLAPSLSGLRRPQGASDPPSSALLVADPVIDRSLFPALGSLRGARAELKAVQPLFPSSVLLEREEATKARILDELERAEVFVFAGHAISHASRPSRSHLVVAPTPEAGGLGLLLAEDLAGRSFDRLRVVVLSACSSAGPRSSRSSGITGLARPFLQAGAKSVVGSLWTIEDGSTRKFFGGFYRDLVRGGPAAEALRQAQLKSIRGQGRAWGDVLTWSSFVVVTR